MQLTSRQRQILNFIESYIRDNGFSPSIREICKHFSLKSTSGVHKILKGLEKKGYLQSHPGKKRAWTPISKDRPFKNSIPVLGHIAAGAPLEAQENLLEDLEIGEDVFGCQGCFGLYVKGDSMIGRHITDGDIAIIKPVPTVEDGQIAAVMVEGLLPEATLKIVKKVENGIELHAANPLYAPLVFNGSDVEGVKILGKMVGLIRRNR